MRRYNCARGGLTMKDSNLRRVGRFEVPNWRLKKKLSEWGDSVKHSSLIPVERIEKAIYLVRGEKVILDRDLAALYEVETRVLNQAVGRNRERFPT